MNTCPNCGKVAGGQSNILQGCVCQYSMQAPPQPKQEPEYAWSTVADYERDVGFQTNEAFRMAWDMARTTKKMLGYPSSSPPQRTWVELTENEIEELFQTAADADEEVHIRFARVVEARLKKKNI